MIKHIWTILCRRSVIDSETNNLSIYDILEQLTIDIKIKKDRKDKVTKINVPIEYEVVSLWTKSPKATEFDGGIKLEIINSEEKIEKTFEQPLKLAKDKSRLRSRIRIKGFVVEKPGIYIFRISYRENNRDKYIKAADIPLEIILKKEEVENIHKRNLN